MSASRYAPPTRVLVPTDFSESSTMALEAAADVARKFKATILLLHIIPNTPNFNGSDFFPETSVLQERKDEIAARLAETKASMAAAGIHVTTHIEEGNDFADTILSVSEREKIDLLVISTHGLSGWRPAVFGSIAEKIIRQSKCPLLLLPSGAKTE